jgi:hypothetical protein
MLARGLPQAQHRAGRVLDRRHPAHVHHVERLGEHIRAEFAGPRRRAVEVVDGHVRRPGRMAIERLEHRRGGAAAQARHHIDAVIRDRVVLELPPEQRAIEVLGRPSVGGGEVRPGEGAVLVALAFAHAADDSRRA